MTLCPACKVEMRPATTTSFAARNLELQADDELECPKCKERVWNWGKVVKGLRDGEAV
jgi:uncharacterized protein with PIN domain